jgi:methylated-DNA-[protein]-cysteine S-methyltransferase
MRVRVLQSTPFGPVAIVWSVGADGPRVARVLLSPPGARADERAEALYPRARLASCAEIEALAAAIAGLLAGDAVDVQLDLADLASRPPFQQAVLRAEHAIPRGRVSTYGLMAAHLGRPAAARAVGNALASNPFPLIVPCHRAIRSDGQLGGYQGGLAMKRALLEMEGVRFDTAQRVVCPRLHYASGVGRS